MSGFFWSPKRQGTEKKTARKPDLGILIPRGGRDEAGVDDVAKQLGEQARLVAEKAAEKEAILEEKAKKRLKPDVDPQGDEFKEVLRYYRSVLAQPDKNIAQITHDNFTRHERSLLTTADKERNPALYKMQQHNRRRYSDILQSKRWQPWVSKADLAFKFTFLHFGLPVAPMSIDSVQQWQGFGDESDESDDEGGVEGHLEDNEPPGGHLRFLNSYTVRSFGYDCVRRPDPVLERYYAFAGFDQFGNKVQPSRAPGYPGHAGHAGHAGLGLRGGGADDDDDDDDDDEEMYDDGGEQSSEDGVQAALAEYDEALEELGEPSTRLGKDTTILSRLAQNNDKGKGKGKLALPLYGLQGMVWFDAADAYTFIDAVDRLLGLGTRSSVRYNVDVYERGVDYNSRERAAWLKDYARNHFEVTCGREGDYMADVSAFENMRRVLGKRFSTAALFISTPEHEPSFSFVPSVNDKVVYLMAKPDSSPYKRPDVAYLRLPDPAPWAVYENQLEPWLRHCMRVLTPGHIWRRPGRPEVPDSFFRMLGPRGSGAEDGLGLWSSYGGLSFGRNTWDAVLASEAQNSVCWVTQRRYLKQPDEKIGDWKILLPGFSFSPFGKFSWKQHVAVEELEDARLLYNALAGVVHAYVHPDAVGAISGVDVWVNGLYYVNHQGVEHETEKVVMPYRHDLHKIDVDQSTDVRAAKILDDMQPLVKAIGTLRQRRNALGTRGLYPAFLAVRPRFKEYKLTLVDRHTKSVACQAFSGMTLADFWKHVKGLCGTNSRVVFQPSKTCVTVTGRQLDDDTSGAGPARGEGIIRSAIRGNKPTYMVSGNMTEEAWNELRFKFADNELLVRMLSHSGEVKLAKPLGLPFGYYDVYAQTDAHLFGVNARGRPKKRRRPEHVRFYDWRWHELDPYLIDEPLSRVPSMATHKDIVERHIDEVVALDKATLGGKSVRFHKTAASSGNRKVDSNALFKRPMTEQQRGQFLREYSYAMPLSVHNENRIPINAPPIESVYNSGHDSLFKVSLGVLTPSEVRRLQEDHYKMRNVALDRALAPAEKPHTPAPGADIKKVAASLNLDAKDIKNVRGSIAKVLQDLDDSLEKLATTTKPKATKGPGQDLGVSEKISALLAALLENKVALNEGEGRGKGGKGEKGEKGEKGAESESSSGTIEPVPPVKLKAKTNARKRATTPEEESRSPAKKPRLSPAKARTPAPSAAAPRLPEDRDTLQVPKTRMGATPALSPRATRARTVSPAKSPGGRALRSRSPEKSPEKSVRKGSRK